MPRSRSVQGVQAVLVEVDDDDLADVVDKDLAEVAADDLADVDDDDLAKVDEDVLAGATSQGGLKTSLLRCWQPQTCRSLAGLAETDLLRL